MKQVVVDSARDIDKIVMVHQLEKCLGSTHAGSQHSDHKKSWTRHHFLVFLDDLRQESKDLKSFASCHHLAASTGCGAPGGEQSRSMDIVTLSAWVKEDL